MEKYFLKIEDNLKKTKKFKKMEKYFLKYIKKN